MGSSSPPVCMGLACSCCVKGKNYPRFIIPSKVSLFNHVVMPPLFCGQLCPFSVKCSDISCMFNALGKGKAFGFVRCTETGPDVLMHKCDVFETVEFTFTFRLESNYPEVLLDSIYL